ncbi:hypothetical protein BVY02_01505 [bacterium J17]|nr:hypothetical protein BVY02_01505 [bacterium J17]
MTNVVNAISVDVEEYFHAANIAEVTGREKWAELPSRVVDSTDKILQIFADHDTRGTFFVLGYVAERHPELVKRIVEQGHELSSHGYGHHCVYDQDPSSFLEDISKTKKLLEDITGQEILGYRAPNFSILQDNDWAYDCLIQAGYRYDSSSYPIRHHRYGNRSRPLEANVITRDGGELLELPMAVATTNIIGKEVRLPVAGGAYWRLLPLKYISWGLHKINSTDKRGANCYLHPWELDPNQPVFEELPFFSKLRHYGKLDQFEKKLSYFLSNFKFGSVRELAVREFGERALKVFEQK